jgi:hypothetical protein|tara:strand:+ start:375 stop:1739 length:1365 start_codon:yes stop_codon:yes gene_type:complete
MVRYILSILQSIPKKAGYKKFLGDNYDEFMESFAELYRKYIADEDVEGLKKFKDEIGKNKFGKLQKHARLNGFITKLDTDAAKVVSSKGSIQQSNIKKSLLNRWNQTENLFTPGKKEMQQAFKQVADEMIANAPRTKQKQPDGSFQEVIQMGGKPFEYKKILPILQQRFPRLFSQFDIDNVYHNSAYRESIRNKVGLPDNIKKESKFEESYLKKQFRNKFRKVDLERKEKLNLQYDDQFMFDLFRSRPDDFRTGKPIQDVDAFLNFLDDVNYFTPTSKNYYRSMDPDFKGYVNFRKMQKEAPKDTQLSHMLHSTVPDPFKQFRSIDAPPTIKPMKGGAFETPNIYMSDPVEFGGADPGILKLLPKKTNIEIQPELEADLHDAIIDFYKTGKSNIAKIEQQMINNNITTKIVDPIGGTESPLSRVYGFVSDVKGPAGMKEGGFASIEEVLEYDNG